MNKQKGITLIALIVTIIVLIILAGISINLILGENGIIAKAQKAAEEQRISNLQEEVAMKMSEREIDIKTGIAKEVEEYLNKIQGAKTTKIKEDTWYVEKNEVTVTVYEDGDIVRERVEIWDGSSEVPEIKDGNWYIYNAKQLKFLADYVNSTNVEKQSEMIRQVGYEESDLTIDSTTTIYIMSDIDLGARKIDGQWENEANEELEWIEIGKTKAKTLLATVEGNYNTIRGVYINSESSYVGVFGNTNSIKNLTVKNGYIKAANSIGGLVGMLIEGTMENCHNVNTEIILLAGCVSGGGLVGQSYANTNIVNCSNTANVTSLGGDATNNNSQIGGIIGFSFENSTINNCHNYGTIKGNGSGVGGILGIANVYSTISNSHNSGIVSGDVNAVGGILGLSASYVIVDNCYNTGIVNGKARGTGGVLGAANTYSTVRNSSNTGIIKGGSVGTGGILGFAAKSGDASNTKVEKCYNSGDINGQIYTGGIVGVLGGNLGKGTILQCYNKGKVVGTTGVGAILGNQENTTGLNTLNHLYYLNTVGIGAINGVDNEENEVMATTENITSYEQFLEWIENK